MLAMGMWLTVPSVAARTMNPCVGYWTAQRN